MSKKLILLVEDNKKVQNFNKLMLERSGFDARTVLTLADAKAFIYREMPDAVILDIGMPDGSGLDFLREVRAVSHVPVLLLTGYTTTTDIVKGFEQGCDDYLTKPYTFEELHARLNRLLQNAEQVPETITKGALTLRLIPQTAFVGGKDLMLTPRDFTLLLYFVQNEGCLLSGEVIYEKVWGRPMAGDSRALGNVVSRLRKKLHGSGLTIAALYGAGYRFGRAESKFQKIYPRAKTSSRFSQSFRSRATLEPVQNLHFGVLTAGFPTCFVMVFYHTLWVCLQDPSSYPEKPSWKSTKSEILNKP